MNEKSGLLSVAGKSDCVRCRPDDEARAWNAGHQQTSRSLKSRDTRGSRDCMQASPHPLILPQVSHTRDARNQCRSVLFSARLRAWHLQVVAGKREANGWAAHALHALHHSSLNCCESRSRGDLFAQATGFAAADSAVLCFEREKRKRERTECIHKLKHRQRGLCLLLLLSN